MTEVTADVEAAVEDTDLPPRLKREVFAAIEARDGVSVEQAGDIAAAVESRYLETRVDPLDPVGTVSAQSIGEPGTQMSVPADERVVVRRDGETAVTPIGPLVDDLLEAREVRRTGGHEVALAPDGLEVPSLGRDERVEWRAVEEVSRHPTPDDLLELELESGRTIRATRSHSFVTRGGNEVVPVAGDALEPGDWLPVVGDCSVTDDSSAVDLRAHLSTDDYWSTTALADGGVTALPDGEDQIRNRRQALEAGDMRDGHVYPVQGTNGLPERFPLDEETGFFVGAFLAEGNATDYYVSVSNVDGEFQERVGSFAARFGLSTKEDRNGGEYGESRDVRVNGTVLADFLRSCAYEDGDKVVPGFAFGADDAFVRGVLSGYFSGDGNVGRNSLRASSTSERLAQGIALLLSRVGVYATFGEQGDSTTLRVPQKYVPRFAEAVGMVGARGEALTALAAETEPGGSDATDQIPNFGDALDAAATAADIPRRQVNSATKRQRIGRTRLASLVREISNRTDEGERPPELDALERAVDGDVVWERIESIESVTSEHEYVYDFSVEGLETFVTGDGVVTHNTMNTFHYAGVAEIDVTQGLPRLIEIVDARKTPDTPMMTVHLAEEYADDRERAHEVVWAIEATRILSLGDVSTNVADMVVDIDLNEETLQERWPTVDDTDEVVAEISETIEDSLGVETTVSGTTVSFGPNEPSYRELLQLVEQLREIVFKGIDDVNRVVIRKEQLDDGEEFVLYTEGSAFGKVLDIEGVDASRTTCNNVHEIRKTLGIEAARESIINETIDTLEEQGLDDVNVRHLMLVADIMTNTGEIQSIGRHGISGSKESVLARAAFEVTVNHLLDAATYGEVDDLNGVTENVIVGKPIELGTGDVDLRMGTAHSEDATSADD